MDQREKTILRRYLLKSAKQTEVPKDVVYNLNNLKLIIKIF